MRKESKDAIKNTLSLFLRKKRILSGKSQKNVAKALGYTSPQFVSNWERGLSQPPLATIRKLALLYSIPQDEIFEVLLRETERRVEEDLRAKFQALRK